MDWKTGTNKNNIGHGHLNIIGIKKSFKTLLKSKQVFIAGFSLFSIVLLL